MQATLRSALKVYGPYVAVGFTIGVSSELIAHYSAPAISWNPPPKPPVAVFVGGTSGIGRSMALSLGEFTKGNASMVIVGRNRAAANDIIARLPKSSNPDIKHEFIQCDVTRMKNVKSATDEILSRHPKINYLVLTPGFLSMKGRDETEEGLDKRLAVNYYSRWKFIQELLPALRKANEEKEGTGVISVFRAGKGRGKIDIQDLGLKKEYRWWKEDDASYNDLMVEELALRNPRLTFIHAHPGRVLTNLYNSSDSAIFRAMGVFQRVFFLGKTNPKHCALYMWSGILGRQPGAYQISSEGKMLPEDLVFRGTEEQRQKLWEHTVEATKTAITYDSGAVITDEKPITE